MNRQSNIIRSLLKAMSFMALILIMTGVVCAQSSLKVTGEIASASQATVNGFTAISGMTVFSNSRIRTGKQGTAIINLGRLGRVELGPDTDMTLRLSKGSVGGELHSNHVVVSAGTGVAIAINTAKGLVTSDGQKPAVLAVDVDSKRANVIAHLGEARVISSGKPSVGMEDGAKGGRVAQGEKLSLSSRGDGRRVASPAVGAIDGADQTKIADQVVSSVAAPARPRVQTFTGLFREGINRSIRRGAGEDRDLVKDPFETSISCRNNDSKHCHKKSEYRPKRP